MEEITKKQQKIHKQKVGFENTAYCEKGVCMAERNDISKMWKKVTCKRCLRKRITLENIKERKKQKKLLKRNLKDKDKEWADKVKERDGHKCVYCGDKKMPNAAHIIPREIKYLKYDIDNGITLCPKHHKFSFEFSAHLNPFRFNDWFLTNRPLQFERLLKRMKEVKLKDEKNNKEMRQL